MRYRLHRIIHWRWYRREKAAGRFYFPARGERLTPRPLDRSDELRSHQQ